MNYFGGITFHPPNRQNKGALEIPSSKSKVEIY